MISIFQYLTKHKTYAHPTQKRRRRSRVMWREYALHHPVVGHSDSYDYNPMIHRRLYAARSYSYSYSSPPRGRMIKS